MAGIVHEELDMKQYDPILIKRLLKYAKPYTFWIIFSIILLILTTAITLVQPIIIGTAVDNIIDNYNKTYSMVESQEYHIEIKGIKLKEKIVENTKKATIVYYDKQYYLIKDIIDNDIDDISKKDKDQSFFINNGKITINKKEYPALLLSKEELKIIRKQDFVKLRNISLIFLLILILSVALGYIQTLILQYTGQKIIYNIRNEVFTHLQGLNVQFFHKHPVGTLVTRVTNDTETLNEMYTSVIVNSARNIFQLSGIVIMMIMLDVSLSLSVFLVVPFIILFTVIFRKFSREAYREVRTKISKINAFLSEHISGMKIVQIFSQEKSVYNEFNRINTDLKKAHIKELLIFGTYRPSIYLLQIVSICLILGFGGSKVIEGTLTLGTLIMFLQYISRFFHPIQELAEQFNILQSAMASSEKIFGLLDEKSTIKEKDEAKTIENIEGKIEFKNVWFAYNDEEWVLKDVSFEVNKGETVAFVGATGAGKTSILNLISRYYDIQKGNILLDGIDIKDMEVNNLRSHIGQMLQDVFLFTGDISSNIRLREENITDDKILKAAKYVNADEFISKMPDKYKEKVYEKGATLSAGQRQLLSFARTLVFDPSILILDEATANIDTETEILIQDALEKLMKGRTTLVVAHRLSTIQHADKIIVLHKGMIREIGNHQELLLKKGLYYNLYQLQYKEQQ